MPQQNDEMVLTAAADSYTKIYFNNLIAIKCFVFICKKRNLNYTLFKYPTSKITVIELPVISVKSFIVNKFSFVEEINFF